MSNQEVRQFYDEAPQDEWDRLSGHPFEFELTAYMLDKYIIPGSTVLDIGGGPGRYALHYAKKGCEVTLCDLSSGNIALAKEKAAEQSVDLTAFACDCLELEQHALGLFDHVLLMGPLYHLTKEEDRVKAVRIALSHLKPGGNLYCSFILDFADIIYRMRNTPGAILLEYEDPYWQQLVSGIISGEGYTGPAFTQAHFISQQAIDPFMAQFGLQKLHLFGQEGILAPCEQGILASPKEEIALWLDLAKRLLEVSQLLAYSEHAMYIGRKLPT